MVNLFSREHNKRTRFTRMCIGEAVFVLMDKKEYEMLSDSKLKGEVENVRFAYCKDGWRIKNDILSLL
mgnify:CR=1 FL=1